MELDFALLAEGATAGERAQVHLIGGGFDTVETDRLPVQIPIALVSRFSVGIDEFQDQHALRFELLRPDGTESKLGEIENAQFPPPVNESRRSHLTAIVKAMLKFSEFGRYDVKVFADSQVVKVLPLHVVEKMTESESDIAHDTSS
jgi:hypothetical protein